MSEISLADRPASLLSVAEIEMPGTTYGTAIESESDHTWELVRELPFFVFAGHVHGVRNGDLDLDPAQLDVRIRGWTGYARLERRIGVATSDENTRVCGYRVAALTPDDRLAVCRQIQSTIDELEDVLHVDPGSVDEQVATLTELTERRKALNVLRPPSWFSRILGNN